MEGRTDVRDRGRYRIHEEPMQVVSGRLDRITVHFEAPPSAVIQNEMDRFNEWFNQTAPGGDAPLSAITRAGIAHLYFVTIHPFEDGNGRVGRAVAEKALAQTLGRPTLLALADAIERRQKDYYRALQDASQTNEITPWLAWFAETVVQAQNLTRARAEFLIEKVKLLDRLRGQLNPRQEKALLRMLEEGPEGFKGGMSADKYIRLTETSHATATRDLQDLVEKGALIRRGELRHTRYFLPIPTQFIPPTV
jgi:Fic family protein